MDFIKNYKGVFTLQPSYSVNRLFSTNLKNLPDSLTNIQIKVTDIDYGTVTFKIHSADNIDTLVSDVQTALVTEFIKRDELSRKYLAKFLKILETSDKCVLKHRGAFTEEPYIFFDHLKDDCSKDPMPRTEMDAIGPNIWFESIREQMHISKYAGVGSGTYNTPDQIRESTKGYDTWCKKTLKKLKSKPIAARIKKYILNKVFSLTFTEVVEHIRVADKPTKNAKTVKPPFPLTITGDEMNSMAYFFDTDFIIIDHDFLNSLQEACELTTNIELLKGWEVKYEYEGEMHHDGQVLDHYITFSDPEGNSYVAHNAHSAMTGWNFNSTANVDLK